jgi:hypothetical protein
MLQENVTNKIINIVVVNIHVMQAGLLFRD